MTDEPIIEPLAGATTPHGFPYPVASDPVAAGAAAIEALARAVDTGNWGSGVLKANGYVAEGASNFPSLTISELTAVKKVMIYIDPSGVFSLDFYGIIGNLITADSTGAVKIMGQRVMRHPYPADRHHESGTLVGGGAQVVSFTAAFAVAPSVTVADQSGAAAAAVGIGTPTLAGVQIYSPTGHAVCWMASGQG